MQDYLTRIRELINVLENSGYYPHQVRDIITDCIGHNNVEKLNQTEASSVINCLQEYISFAQRCRQNKGAAPRI